MKTLPQSKRGARKAVYGSAGKGLTYSAFVRGVLLSSLFSVRE